VNVRLTANSALIQRLAGLGQLPCRLARGRWWAFLYSPAPMVGAHLSEKL